MSSVLILCNLLAATDMVNNQILLSNLPKLHFRYSTSGFESCLTEHSVKVSCQGGEPKSHFFPAWVLQESEFGRIISQYSVHHLQGPIIQESSAPV